jgi:hypothetical protein
LSAGKPTVKKAALDSMTAPQVRSVRVRVCAWGVGRIVAPKEVERRSRITRPRRWSSNYAYVRDDPARASAGSDAAFHRGQRSTRLTHPLPPRSASRHPHRRDYNATPSSRLYKPARHTNFSEAASLTRCNPRQRRPLALPTSRLKGIDETRRFGRYHAAENSLRARYE